MFLFDLRRQLVAHCFRGFAGSIRSISCHPDLPVVASCSLDRFVRVHDLNNFSLTHKIYLKSRLNCLLMRSDYMTGSKDETPEVKEEPVDSDVLWDKMTAVEEKRGHVAHKRLIKDMYKRTKDKKLRRK
jgi:ribosome biogenesis protein NSA1